jgi:hypothetical protein
MLTRVAQDTERAVRAVEQAEGLLDEEAVEQARALLRELIAQDPDVEKDSVPRLHRGTRQDRIVSVHDPEMNHGRDSGGHRFGRLQAAAATNIKWPPITTVEVGASANEQDGPQAARPG